MNRRSAQRIPRTGSQSDERALRPRQLPRGVPVAVLFDHHPSHLPLQSGVAADGCHCSGKFKPLAVARSSSWRIIMAQAVRAVLLAMATVTSRVGLRPRSDRTQAPVRVSVVSARRADDQQASQIPVAHLRDVPEAVLAPGRVLSGQCSLPALAPKRRGSAARAGHRREVHE